MAGINWDVVFYIDLNTLQPAQSGVPVPTYGNYGGAGYSEGVFGPPVAPYVPPVDALDNLFLTHDVASYAATTPGQQAEADLALLQGIVALNPAQLDPEASLYGGFAALAMIEQLAANNALDLLSPQKLACASQEAVSDIENGLARLDAAELNAARNWLGQAAAVTSLTTGDALGTSGLELHLPGFHVPHGDWSL